MNTAITGTALTLHNLGVAAGFGGSLFGQMAMHPAMESISEDSERGELLHNAWRNFSPVNAAGLALVGLTWLTGRNMLTGGEIDATTRALVIAKDVLVATYVATGLASIGVGFAATSDKLPSEESTFNTDIDGTATKVSGHLGRVSIIAAAGIIALTAVLNVRAGRSSKWSVISRFLP